MKVRLALAVEEVSRDGEQASSPLESQRRNIRPITRDCSAALFPVCEEPSSLRIFFRSLLMSVLERSVMVAAICCTLDAMVWWCSAVGRQAGLESR